MITPSRRLCAGTVRGDRNRTPGASPPRSVEGSVRIAVHRVVLCGGPLRGAVRLALASARASPTSRGWLGRARVGRLRPVRSAAAATGQAVSRPRGGVTRTGFRRQSPVQRVERAPSGVPRAPVLTRRSPPGSRLLPSVRLPAARLPEDPLQRVDRLGVESRPASVPRGISSASEAAAAALPAHGLGSRCRAPLDLRSALVARIGGGLGGPATGWSLLAACVRWRGSGYRSYPEPRSLSSSSPVSRLPAGSGASAGWRISLPVFFLAGCPGFPAGASHLVSSSFSSCRISPCLLSSWHRRIACSLIASAPGPFSRRCSLMPRLLNLLVASTAVIVTRRCVFPSVVVSTMIVPRSTLSENSRYPRVYQRRGSLSA